MPEILKEDYEANKQGKPAFRRFKLLKQIDTIMRNGNTHSVFIDKGGLMNFSSWLKPMPDGSYPNQKIVLTILQCLDLIDIHEEDQGDQLKDLEQMLKVYKDSSSATYEECRKLATVILNKWRSKWYSVTTNYRYFQDQDNLAQRKFESLIENEKKKTIEKEKKRFRMENPDA